MRRRRRWREEKRKTLAGRMPPFVFLQKKTQKMCAEKKVATRGLLFFLRQLASTFFMDSRQASTIAWWWWWLSARLPPPPTEMSLPERAELLLLLPLLPGAAFVAVGVYNGGQWFTDDLPISGQLFYISFTVLCFTDLLVFCLRANLFRWQKRTTVNKILLFVQKYF